MNTNNNINNSIIKTDDTINIHNIDTNTNINSVISIQK